MGSDDGRPKMSSLDLGWDDSSGGGKLPQFEDPLASADGPDLASTEKQEPSPDLLSATRNEEPLPSFSDGDARLPSFPDPDEDDAPTLGPSAIPAQEGLPRFDNSFIDHGKPHDPRREPSDGWSPPRAAVPEPTRPPSERPIRGSDITALLDQPAPSHQPFRPAPSAAPPAPEISVPKPRARSEPPPPPRRKSSAPPPPRRSSAPPPPRRGLSDTDAAAAAREAVSIPFADTMAFAAPGVETGPSTMALRPAEPSQLNMHTVPLHLDDLEAAVDAGRAAAKTSALPYAPTMEMQRPANRADAPPALGPMEASRASAHPAADPFAAGPMGGPAVAPSPQPAPNAGHWAGDYAPPGPVQAVTPAWAKAAIGIGVVLGLGAIGLLTRFALAPSKESGPASAVSAAPAVGAVDTAPAPSDTPVPTAVATSTAAAAVPTATATAEPAAAKTAGDVPADVESALATLQAGISGCVRDTIGVLPGTAPPVPISFHFVRGDGYQSHALDWRSPVYQCAHFKLTEPQRFVIQWQSVKVNREGVGIALLDENGDKEADVSYSFTATLRDDRTVAYGPISRDNEVRKIQR